MLILITKSNLLSLPHFLFIISIIFSGCTFILYSVYQCPDHSVSYTLLLGFFNELLLVFSKKYHILSYLFNPIIGGNITVLSTTIKNQKTNLIQHI